MKICLISKSDIKGGAAKVAYVLAAGLRKKGHVCTMLVQTKSTDADWVNELPAASGQRGKVSNRIIHRLGLNALNLEEEFPKSMGRAYFEQFDLIHLHDLPDQFNFRHLSWLSSIRPVFWTLHTMHAFTGGCIYTYGCDRHLKSCGKCPQFGKFPLMWLHRDGSRLILFLRKLVYSRSRLYPICVSEWLTEEARKGVLGQFPIRTILNPVDQEQYRPIDKAEAKQRLGIDPAKRTIFFSVAANPLDVRKGFDVICKAIPKLELENICLLPTVISAESEELEVALQDVESLPPRHLSTDEELRLYYSAADVVWHPTRADTSSMVSLEALSCGTPVIAAGVGGVQEIVRDGVNGIVIGPESPEQLVEATRRFFLKPEFQECLSRGARASIQGAHNLDAYLDQHLAAYRIALSA